MKLFIFLILLPLVSFARWATPDEYDFALNRYDSVYEVKKDGSYTVDIFKEFEILKASAVDPLSTYVENYNPYTSKITLTQAWVVTDGNKVVMPSTVVSEKPTATSNIFDGLTEWSVKFSDVKVGSKLALQYRITVTKPLIAGHFSFSHYFGTAGMWIKEGSFTVRSELPLEVATVDPKGTLKVERLKKKQEEVKVSLIKPISRNVVEEYGGFSPELTSAVFFSTSRNWDLVRRQFQSLFDLSLSTPLTPELLALLEKARAKHELGEQINILLHPLITQLKYAGDWRLIKGSLTPRSVSEIFKSRYADDKELASCMVIMLRKLGYGADVVIAEKTAPQLSRIRALPIPVIDLFNHALVRLSVNGETYWIDPSLPTSFGINLGEDMHGKIALPLNENGEIVKLPVKNPDPYSISIVNTYEFETDTMAYVQSKMTMTGTPAYTTKLGYFHNRNQKEFEKQIVLKMTSYQKPAGHKFAPFELKVHDFKNLEFSSQIKVATAGGKDEKGTFINVPDLAQSIRPFLLPYVNWEMDLYMGEPSQFKREHAYKNVILTGENTFKPCDIDNKWVQVKRTHTYMNKTLTTLDVFIVKEPNFSSAELRSKEFLNFQKQLATCEAGAKFYYKK